MFLDIDAAAASSSVKADLPVRLAGRSGDLVASMWVAAGKDGAKFAKVAADLKGFVAAVTGAGLVVDRFFTTSNYSAEECHKVLDLLMTEKEPLKDFASIKDADVKEILVDNEGNLDAWRGARKAVAALAMSAEAKAALCE